MVVALIKGGGGWLLGRQGDGRHSSTRGVPDVFSVAVAVAVGEHSAKAARNTEQDNATKWYAGGAAC